MTKIAAASGTVSFTQLGVDIDGNRNNNVPSYGGINALSSDGRRLVIGSPQYRTSESGVVLFCEGIVVFVSMIITVIIGFKLVQIY